MTMSEDFKDLEARLREAYETAIRYECSFEGLPGFQDLRSAADAIASLRAERDALRDDVDTWRETAFAWQQERDAARAVTEWRDIATAPKDGTKVWAFGSGWFCPSIIAADGEWWRMRQAEGYTGQPTHWMPLQVPAPPISMKAKR
jgi:hypothetical protein